MADIHISKPASPVTPHILFAEDHEADRLGLSKGKSPKKVGVKELITHSI